MLKRYKFTSKAFVGHVIFAYENGVAKEAQFECELNEKQLEYFRSKFPITSADLPNLKGTYGKIEEIQADLSFLSFWDFYGVKINKKRVEPLWEKLKKTEKVAVFEAIPRYRFYTKSKGISMANPENYLRDGRWEDELDIKK